MSLNSTPSSERIHIGIFGKRNAGKSSIINALTGQNLAIVSDVKGTTTDPVLKAMELLPLGPVVMIDTPGLDDDGDLGALRIQKAYQVLNKTDIAILVVDGTVGMTEEDYAILRRIKEKAIPSVVVLNKADIAVPGRFMDAASLGLAPEDYFMWVSASDKSNIYELKELIATLVPPDDSKLRIVSDLVKPSDFILLVVPIDKAAPKGRLILPQQQTIRDILEADAAAVVIKDNELSRTLSALGKRPAMIITDSQVFGKVSKETPDDIPLTSFSILFARYKGSLRAVVDGARTLDTLDDGDTVLIAEGCTHHRQCDDIGTVKLPSMVQDYTGKNINFEFTSGTEFPIDLSTYKLVIHCGGCTLNEREMKYRLKCTEDAHLPITNYGVAIAHMNGILERSIEIFPEL
ncbi:[FeFe] hydrogenase H-cluster maturation GTPase HydF [Dorea sp. D27]|uniref:[FeFe] hydrogenase H-cluster maturation GTPase HydF n=1 Tax=Dorea sp. D27 TaxID=658665 RepID=UPI0006731D11|nr:[FeFe] hydrogenase H-cluster maturation GTPase HydF [Dorea sp. D27]KMZ53849.1 GTP-binding protein [Dorea sp. D27]